MLDFLGIDAEAADSDMMSSDTGGAIKAIGCMAIIMLAELAAYVMGEG
ncbi:MAG: hypothetical protein LBS35_02080 [Synergistaceae bacterium]|jgi:hypothetical protein|nr:hypothetical protein [Synergistaceae bacterium]